MVYIELSKDFIITLYFKSLSSKSLDCLNSCIACTRKQMSLVNVYLLLSCSNSETSSFLGASLPCCHLAGWICKIRLLITSQWSIQQSAPLIILLIWRHVCLSSALWHSQWDNNILSKGAARVTYCGLVDRKLHLAISFGLVIVRS